MADLTIHGNPLQQDVPYKLHDNGDGTYSLPVSSSGGGGGAVTVADGADVAQGTTTDASSASTVIGLLKNLKAALAGTVAVSIASNSSTAASTATLANVGGSASSVTLIALNTNRLGGVIVNDSSAILYIKYGSSASATSFTYVLQGSASGAQALELPANPRYTGIITGIWASATGNARVTELTA